MDAQLDLVTLSQYSDFNSVITDETIAIIQSSAPQEILNVAQDFAQKATSRGKHAVRIEGTQEFLNAVLAVIISEAFEQKNPDALAFVLTKGGYTRGPLTGSSLTDEKVERLVDILKGVDFSFLLTSVRRGYPPHYVQVKEIIS